MNDVKLMGRMVADPVLKTFKSGAKSASFFVACSRFTTKEGQPTADFIPCVVWGKLAEIICKYFSKGQRILISRGEWRSAVYEKDGHKQYRNFCLVLGFEFASDKVADVKEASVNRWEEFGKLIPEDDFDIKDVDSSYEAAAIEFERISRELDLK